MSTQIETNHLIPILGARMNVVMTLKTTYIQFRVRKDIKRDLQIVAELHGLSMSAFIHSVIVKAIR